MELAENTKSSSEKDKKTGKLDLKDMNWENIKNLIMKNPLTFGKF